MIYTNTSELIELLKRENLWAKKRFGQNFLVNPEVLQKIVRAAEITPKDNIVEIGPGLGILTEQLATNAQKVTSIELDQEIIPTLKKNIETHKNVEIILADALKIDLPTEPYKLVANIPYYITSPILNHYLQPKTPEQKRPSIIVLLVQKEVAEKVCAADGDHTILSLQVQAFGKPQIICKVGKNSFFPQPNVDSMVLKIETYPEPKITNIPIFFKLLKAAFHQRRKTLSNSLKNGLKITAEQAETLFKTSGIAPTARPQEISLDGWEKLIQAYESISL